MKRNWFRRARRALQRTGPFGFLRLLLHNLRIVFRGQSGRYRYINDSAWDRAYGVDTRGTVDVEELTAPDHEKRGAVGYEPTPPEAFPYLLSQAEISDCSDWTFIDLGSGKGRTLLLAALAGFPKVIGVELGEELHAVACRNIDEFRRKTSIGHLSSIRADASSYQFPDDPTVCFINNPFSGEVLVRVVENIEASLRGHPRPFKIIYYHSNHAEVIDRRAGWEELRTGAWTDESHHYAIYTWIGGE